MANINLLLSILFITLYYVMLPYMYVTELTFRYCEESHKCHPSKSCTNCYFTYTDAFHLNHLPLFICPNHMLLVIAQHLEIPYDEITVNIVLCMMSTQRHMINTWTRIIVVNEDCKQPIHGIAKSTAKELERISNSL